LKQGDVVITEAAAICAYLADEFPQRKLNIPVGDPRRGVYFKWLFFGPSCIEPAIMDRAYPRNEAAPRSALGYGGDDGVLDNRPGAVTKGRYPRGDEATAADVVAGAGLRWGSRLKRLPEGREFTAYTARLAERPALKRAEAKDKDLAAA